MFSCAADADADAEPTGLKESRVCFAYLRGIDVYFFGNALCSFFVGTRRVNNLLILFCPVYCLERDADFERDGLFASAVPREHVTYDITGLEQVEDIVKWL